MTQIILFQLDGVHDEIKYKFICRTQNHAGTFKAGEIKIDPHCEKLK